MKTALDLAPSEATQGRSAERPADAARETTARTAGGLPSCGPGGGRAVALADRRATVRAIAPGMHSP